MLEGGDRLTDIHTDIQTDQTERLHEFHRYMELKTKTAFRFISVKIIGISGSVEANFDDFCDFCYFGEAFRANGLFFWRPKLSKIRLFECCFFDVFLSVLFSCFFEILGAQRLHFERHFDSFLGGLGLCKM